MTFKKWKSLIVKKTKEAGTYEKIFDPVIDTLAHILEERDRVRDQYIEEGSQALVDFNLDRGGSNKKKNPLLTIWQEADRDALQYWRDLGLTPAGLRKINEEAMAKQNNMSALDRVLANLEK